MGPQPRAGGPRRLGGGADPRSQGGARPTPPVVVDASALVEYATGTALAPLLARIVEASDITLHVPELCDLELASALHKAVLARRLRRGRAEEALAIYISLPIFRHRHRRLLARAWSLRGHFTPYDAAYIALAEELDAPLLTVDERLARAMRRHTQASVLTP